MSTHPMVPSPGNGAPPNCLAGAAPDVQVPEVPDTIEDKHVRGPSCEHLDRCQSPPAKQTSNIKHQTWGI